MLLYIIRHGDPDYTTDTLTERGWAQAEAVGKRLAASGINRVFSSPMGRAKQTAEPTCRRNFCAAVRPPFCFLRILTESSMTPIKPDTTAKSRVIRNSAARRKPSGEPVTAQKTIHRTTVPSRDAAMKARPPIVGVPSLLLCQRGPMSSIFCPTFMLLSFGIMNLVAIAVSAKTEKREMR